VVAVNMNKAFEVSRNHNGNNFAMVRYRAFLGGVRRSKLERSCATKKTKLRPELRTRTADLVVAAAASPSRPAARLGCSVIGCASRGARCRQPADATTCPLDSDPGALASFRTRTFTQGAGQDLDVLPIGSGSYSGWTLREQRGQVRHLRSENHSL